VLPDPAFDLLKRHGRPTLHGECASFVYDPERPALSIAASISSEELPASTWRAISRAMSIMQRSVALNHNLAEL
jgi:hypothetical protein